MGLFFTNKISFLNDLFIKNRFTVTQVNLEVVFN
jgi:hypothetical protein